MRKSVFILLASFLICCSKKEQNDIEGYYYNQDNANIFKISKNSIVEYDLFDSVPYSKDFTFKNGVLRNTYDKYRYSKKGNDSLILHNFSDNGEDIMLVKFDKMPLNELSLDDTNWFSKELNGTEITQYMKFVDRKTMRLIFDYQDDFEKDLNPIVTYKGSYFDEFDVFNFNNIIIPINIKESRISFLIIDYFNNNKMFISSFKKVKSSKLASNLVGEWKTDQREYERSNYKTYLEKKIEVDREDSNYFKQLDSIRDLLDYKSIEFTKGFKFKRFLDRNKNTVVLDLETSPLTEYVFTKNPSIEGQYFQILYHSKDSLKIKISEPELIVNYYRKK